MNKVLVSLVWAVSCLVFVGPVSAQKKLIILVRHAEKADPTIRDPELSAEGKQRAERLLKVIKKYKPGEIYSTDYKRTRDTVAPMAARRHKEIQIYNSKAPKELLDRILKSRTKRFLVAGHSNSIPGLANLIGGKELFKDLDESEFGTIWLIRLKDGKLRKIEILPY